MGRKDMPPGPGRPKGLKNKATTNAREAIALFVDNNAHRLEGWLDEIAKKDPKQAFDCFQSVIEYHIPKLARTENTTNVKLHYEPLVIEKAMVDVIEGQATVIEPEIISG